MTCPLTNERVITLIHQDPEMVTGGIAGGGVMALLSSHPPLESRIAALQSG